MTDLKPCPFCKCKYMDIRTYVSYEKDCFYVVCLKCYARIHYYNTKEKATEIWNKRPNPWRPIEEAPRDGTYIVLYSKAGINVGCWEENRYCMLGSPQGSFGAGWVDKENYLPIFDEFEPTHFMPIPEFNDE